MPIYNVAVVGSGVAGLSAAHLIKKQHRVTIFEAADKLGGHTNTVTCALKESSSAESDSPTIANTKTIDIDTGFIVCNDVTYPTFHKFLAELGVPWRYTDMSVSVADSDSGLEYCSRSLDTVFAQRNNLFAPKFLKMIFEIVRFWRVASVDLARGLSDDETLGQWLVRHRFSGAIVSDYLLPIAAAVWSSSQAGILDFPVGTFLEFYRNHGFLRFYRQPRWQTVVGASQRYIDAFCASFPGDIVLNSAVTSIVRTADTVLLSGPQSNGSAGSTGHAGKSYGEFDYVVIATHADQVLKVLGEANARADEKDIFSSWQYQKNLAVLHQDESIMPKNKKAWGSWNYRKESARNGSSNENAPVSVTYDMNNLQGLTVKDRFFVTLNPRTPLAGEIARFNYEHPMYSKAALQGRKRLVGLQGHDRTFYAGSYHGYGFHEDAVKSGVAVAALLGCGFSSDLAVKKN